MPFIASAAEDSGQLEKRIERQTPVKESKPIDSDISRPEPASRIQGAPDKTITLTGVDIVGNTAYPRDELASLYEDYLGREITLADVETILQAITYKYRSGGFTLSRATAPAQDVEFGVLRIEIVEGYVDKIRFAGARAGRQGLPDAYAEAIKAERPLTLATLERYLLLMSDLPGLTVRPAMREIEGGAPGAFELTITLEHNPVGAVATLSNRGTSAVGPLQALLGVDANSALGLWERTRLLHFTVPDQMQEIRFFQITHEQPVGTEGTTVSVAASRSTIHTRDRLTSRRQDGEGESYNLTVRHPIVRAREQNLYLTGRFDIVNSRQEQTGSNFNDRIRSLRVGANFVASDGWDGVSSVAIEASKGLDAFGANGRQVSDLSRTNGRAQYRKVTLDFGRQQTLPGELVAVASVSGQWSPERLLSAEEFAIGGGRYGRAFDPGELTGSDGVAVSAELRRTFALDWDFPKRVELYGFWDWGAVWPTDSRRETLASAGGGLRFEFGKGFVGGVELAKPLTRSPVETGDRSPRAFFFINVAF